MPPTIGKATLPRVPAPVAVVILTWNALESTQACLRALLARTDHSAWRLIVVDNGSTDGTVPWLRCLEWVTLIENRENLGFTRGCNIGIAAARADEDIVLMNNDVFVVDPGWLSALQRVAYSQDDIGIVGSRLVDGQGLILHLGSYMPPLTLRGHQMGGLELDIGQCDQDRPVESVVFAQAYLRRNCVDTVGKLDERLFAYFEDTDYCLRAIRAGYKVVCASSPSPPVHRQSTSASANGVDLSSLYEKSRLTFKRSWAEWLEHERYELEIVWHSVLHQPIGYAVQSRKLMTALHFAGARIAYQNAYGTSEGPTRDLLLDDIRRRRPGRDVTQLAFSQADAFIRVRGRPRVGWSMLEVTGLPPAWVDGANSMDEVWVPAAFNVETFRNSGVRVPIRQMALGVDTDYFHPRIAGHHPSNRFVFLSVFEWGERKAPELLLEAYTSEFKASDDVLLLLSVVNRDPVVDVHREVAKLDLPQTAPVVVMVNPGFESYQMGALYRSADCFVLPTRGEGWGMPVLEAMACGLPAIVTDWSGPADFLHDDVGYPLRVEAMVPARARCPYYAGFEWAEPDAEHLRSLMRDVYEDPERAKAKGAAAAIEVGARYSWEQVASRVKARLLELS